MTPDLFYTRIVEPTLQYMAASPSINVPVSDAARVLVMAIAGQESRWKDRKQIGGPARGYWQFEPGPMSGTAQVFMHAARPLGTVCASYDITYDQATVFDALTWHDPLACAMARLLLWTDPRPLPAYWDKAAGWQYYVANWHPGAPHPETWSALHDQAMAAVGLPPK